MNIFIKNLNVPFQINKKIKRRVNRTVQDLDFEWVNISLEIKSINLTQLNNKQSNTLLWFLPSVFQRSFNTIELTFPFQISLVMTQLRVTLIMETTTKTCCVFCPAKSCLHMHSPGRKWWKTLLIVQKVTFFIMHTWA